MSRSGKDDVSIDDFTAWKCGSILIRVNAHGSILGGQWRDPESPELARGFDHSGQKCCICFQQALALEMPAVSPQPANIAAMHDRIINVFAHTF